MPSVLGWSLKKMPILSLKELIIQETNFLLAEIWRFICSTSITTFRNNLNKNRNEFSELQTFKMMEYGQKIINYEESIEICNYQ